MLVVLSVLLCVVGGQYVPEPQFVRHHTGFRLTLPDVPGTKTVLFRYDVIRHNGSVTSQSSYAKKGMDGKWYYVNEDLRPTDSGEIRYSVKTNIHGERFESPVYKWKASESAVLPGRRLRGAVIFRDDFSGSHLDRNAWTYVVSMFGGYHDEFQMYTPEEANVFVKHGHLHIKPTLTADFSRFSEPFLHTGTIDMKAMWGSCMYPLNTGRGCVRSGQDGLLPPVMSGMIMSKATMKYGSLEIRAKMPKGDWLWPAIWMMPKHSHYGGWPRSGEIDIAEARSNIVAKPYNGENEGVNLVTCSLHWGTSGSTMKTVASRRSLHVGHDFSTGFHTYRIDWTPTHITTYLDGQEMMHATVPSGGFWEKGHFSGNNLWSSGEKMAPFDQPFYLILNVAVGGTSGYFPDSFHYNTKKPWRNHDSHGVDDFWAHRSDWLPTWRGDHVAMQIDYVEMRSL